MYNIYMVSVIMPTYNCGAFIGEAIKSVKMQTYQVWELIVVDDCSTDNTESVTLFIICSFKLILCDFYNFTLYLYMLDRGLHSLTYFYI